MKKHSDARKRLYRLRRRLRDAQFRFAMRHGPRCRLPGAPPLTAILPSYKRPGNMEVIVGALLRCDFVARVVVSNNNPEVRIGDWIRARDERLELIDQPQHMPPTIRLQLARESGADHLVSIDDDVFLTPQQIRRVYGFYLESPELLHGTHGHLLRWDERSAQPSLRRKHYDGPVDTLNGVYFFSRAHVLEAFELLGLSGRSWRDVRFSDDVVLSYCGAAHPRCHDVGRFRTCETSSKPGTALWVDPGFGKERTNLRRKLQPLRGREPLAKAPAEPARRTA